jgi:subtilisin family serine protease
VELESGREAAFDAWAHKKGAPTRAFRFQDARVVEVGAASDARDVASLPGVIGVYPNHVVSVGPSAGKPKPGGGGTGQTIPAGIQRIKADQTWSTATGAGAGVAIVDTGIDLANPDLTVGAQCFTAYSTCADVHGHGTHVSGIAAAVNNTIGVVGVAPAATVYSVRVLGDTGSGTDDAIISGLEWVLANATSVSPPIRVANMSLGRAGSVDDNPVLHTAVQDLVNAGISVVVAAGNDSGLQIAQQIPAAYPEVFAIASTSAQNGQAASRGPCAGIIIPADTASYFTTDGVGVVISAPGEDAENVTNSCGIQSLGILSLSNGGGGSTVRMSGTSMASPTVAGVVALLSGSDPTLQPSDLRARLASSAACAGTAPKDSPTSSYTFDGTREGVVDALSAVTGSAPTCP